MKNFSILVTAAFAISCQKDREVESNVLISQNPVQVVTTIGMITDVVREVGGSRVAVRGLISEGIDPHLYKPSRSDVVALREADVVFYNGLLLEGKMADLFSRLDRADKPVVAVAERFADGQLKLLQKTEEAGVDPHIWMDVSAWMQAVGVVAETLARFDPEQASAYMANADAYTETLKALDLYAESAIATIPKDRRILITAHDAFQYFGNAYGIEVMGIQGLSTESEAGVKDLESLISLIVEKSVPSVFVESSVADKNVRALVEGAQARGQTVTIGGTLYSDAMGPAGSYEGTYVGMIDHNVKTIVNALGGSTNGFQAYRSERE